MYRLQSNNRLIAFGEFVELVRNSGSANDFYMTANNDSKKREVLQELWNAFRHCLNICAEVGPNRDLFLAGWMVAFRRSAGYLSDDFQRQFFWDNDFYCDYPKEHDF